MASSSYSLVSAHTSSVFVHTPDVVNVSSRGTHPNPKGSNKTDDLVSDHASYATVFSNSQAQILFRLINNSRTIELTSLTDHVPPIHYHFPSPVLPSPGIIFDDPEIHVIACTVDGSVFRLVFSLPDLWTVTVQREGRRVYNNWCHEYSLKTSVANLQGPVHVKEAATVFIGLKDGGILRLQAFRTNGGFGEWSETTMGASSFIRLPSLGIFHSRPPAGHMQLLSFATVPNPSPSLAIFTLDRYRQLRAWIDTTCVATTTIAPSFELQVQNSSASPSRQRPVELLDADPRQYLLVLPPSGHIQHDDDVDNDLSVLVFMPSTGGGFFSLYHLSKDGGSTGRTLQHVGSKECTVLEETRYPRGFLLADEVLWVLWDKQGVTSVEYTQFDIEGEEQADWLTVSQPVEYDISPTYFEEKLSTHGSLTDTFLTALITPGSFSRSTLEAATAQYRVSLSSIPGPHTALLNAPYPLLMEQISAIVGSTVNLTSDPQTGEQLWTPYWNALKRDWEGFMARCREIERAARWPLTLCAGTTGSPIIIERERMGTVERNDKVMALRSSLSSSSEGGAHHTLLRMARSMHDHILPIELLTIQNAILNQTRQEVLFSYLEIAQDLANRSLSEVLSEDFCEDFSEKVTSFEHFEDTVEETLAVLVSLDEDVEVKLEDESEEIDSPNVVEGEWARAMAASYVSSTMQARYDVALSIVTLLIYVTDKHPDLISSEPSVLGEAFAALHAISSLRHVCRTPGGDPRGSRPRSREDDVTLRLDEMTMNGLSRRRNAPTYSLLHLIMPPTFPTSYTPTAAHRFLRLNGILRPRNSIGVEMPEVKFIHQILDLGYLDTARELADWLPMAPGVLYVLAMVQLDSGRVDEAASLLEQIGNYFASEALRDTEDFRALDAILPQEPKIETLADYYRHALRFFKGGAVLTQLIRFCKLAIASSPVEETKDLWVELFKAYEELGMYEEAYMTIYSTPFDDLQREFIRHLVTVMAEADAVDRLISFNFMSFQDEVEQILAWKARNTDPRAQPDYFKILYAWYIVRGDYRSAGGAVYQQGRRLALMQGQSNDDPKLLATSQAGCYLAAINALSLVDSKNAWVEMSLTPGEAARNTKLRHVIHLSPDSLTTGSLDTEIVDIAEMRQEYLLVLSQLELMNTFPEMTLSDAATSGEEIVTKYMEAGLFDSAMSVARSLKVDMTALFGNLTSQCVHIATLGDKFDLDAITWLNSDRVSSWEGTPSQKAWRYLRLSLETHDTGEIDFIYRKAVVRKILDLDRFARIPPWLLKFFEEKQPDFLIKMSLAYELFGNALKQSLQLLRKETQNSKNVPGNQSSRTYLPYTLIDQVLLETDQHQNELSSGDKDVAKELRAELNVRLKGLQKDR